MQILTKAIQNQDVRGSLIRPAGYQGDSEFNDYDAPDMEKLWNQDGAEQMENLATMKQELDEINAKLDSEKQEKAAEKAKADAAEKKEYDEWRKRKLADDDSSEDSENQAVRKPKGQKRRPSSEAE